MRDCVGAEMKLAQQYINLLSNQFPDSLRVKRLEGMMWEAKGEADLAMAEMKVPDASSIGRVT